MLAFPSSEKLSGTLEKDLGQSPEIKIIDFGLGKIFKQNADRPLTDLVGSTYYLAPEVIDGKYGIECDCWSLGVIMYVLLSGYLPFPGHTRPEVFNRIKAARVRFQVKEFQTVSESAKDLIKKLLEKDPAKRYTCA